MNSGQVMHRPYKKEEGKLVLKEMADLLSMQLVEKGLVTKQIVLYVGYDIQNIKNMELGLSNSYAGEIQSDHYGRKVPKYCRATINLES